jgi:hypothetical protein
MPRSHNPSDVLADDLPALRPDRQHAAIRASFKFTPVVHDRKYSSSCTVPVFRYQCPDGRCNFGPVVDQMLASADLKSWQAERSCAEIVADISAHQSEYLPAKIYNISVYRMGQEIARLESDVRTPAYRSGSIAYDDVHRRVRDEMDDTVARRYFSWTDRWVRAVDNSSWFRAIKHAVGVK